MPESTLTTVLVALASAAVVAVAVLLGLRRTLGSAEQSRLAAAEALAEEYRSEVDQLRDQVSHTQQSLARLDEANRRLEADIGDRDRRLDDAAAELGEAQERLEALRAEHERVRAEAEAREARAAERIEALEANRESMSREFRMLADESLNDSGARLTDRNAEQLEQLLRPLQSRLADYQQGLDASRREAAENQGRLEAQLRQLGEKSDQMARGAEDLTRALRSDAQVQGAWGEMVLESILERSGLRRGEEYAVQTSVVTDEGVRLRPDVVVNLPNDHHIIIDSKVSLVAFERHVNAADDLERGTCLDAHLQSLRGHVRSLALKRYETRLGFTPDYVIMFVPIEGALAAALAADPELTGFALERNVTIASPTSLMTLLRTVYSLWQVERRNRNAEAIAERAGRLYDKFVGFARDMDSLGARIRQTQAAHDAAFAKLTGGRGNLVRQAEALRTLGARTGKRLDAALLDAAGEDTQDDDEPAALPPVDTDQTNRGTPKA